MKKLIVILAVLLSCLSLQAQDVKVIREGKTFTKETVKEVKTSEPKKSGFQYKDSKGIVYDIYVGPTGSCYILRTSKNTGKEYKQYLGEEISSQICKDLNIEYKKKEN